MSSRLVGTNAEFTSAIGAAGVDDIVILDDNVITDYISITKAGVTVRGQSARVAKLPRVCVNAQDITIAELLIQMANYDPHPYGDVTANRAPDLISTQGNTNNLHIVGNHIRCGNYEDGQQPFDVTNTEKYLAYVGSVKDGLEPWKVPAYPRFLGHLTPAGTLNGSMTGSLTVEDNLMEDTGGDAIKFGHNGGGAAIRIRRNRIQRVYQDFCSIGLPGGRFQPFSLFEFTGNTLWDPFNQTQDYGAHGDNLQLFSQDIGGWQLYFATPPASLPVAGQTVTFTGQVKNSSGVFVPGTETRPITSVGTSVYGFYVIIGTGSWYSVGTGNCSFSNGSTATCTKVGQARPGPSDALTSWDNLFIAGNVIGMSENCRGQVQTFFLSDIPPGAPFRGSFIGWNAGLRRVGGAGVIISNDGIAGGAHCMVWQNTILAHAVLNKVDPNANEAYPHAGQGAAGTSPTRISVFRDSIYTGQNLVGRNVIEAITPQVGQDTASYPNLVTGMLTPANPNGAAAAYDIDWENTYTPEGLITELAKNKLPGFGAVEPGQTYQEFIDAFSHDTKPYYKIPSYVGFQPTTNVPIGQTTPVISDWAKVQIFEPRPYEADSDVQFCDDFDPNNGGATGVGAWLPAGSTGTVNPGKWVRFRKVPSVLPAVQVQAKLKVGNETSVWRLTTLDTTNFPHVTLDKTQIMHQATTGGLKTITTSQCTVVLEVVMPMPGEIVNLMGQESGVSEFGIQLLPPANGGVTTTSIRISGLPGGRVDVPVLTTPGQKHHLIITSDTTKPSKEEGIKVAVDYARISNLGLSGGWTVAPVVFPRVPTTKMQVGGSGVTPKISGSIGLLAIYPGFLADLDNQADIDMFRAAYIGPEGQGPFGEKPPIMLVGKAATWNTGNPNRGDGQAWLKAMGNPITDADANLWPPNLFTVAEVMSPGTRPVGSPTTIRVKALGFPKPVDFTPHSDKAGTWNRTSAALSEERDGYADFEFTPLAAGTHTFSFTNDGSYNNPPTVSMLADNGVPVENPTAIDMDLSVGSVTAGASVTVTFTLDRIATQSVTITPSDGAAPGTFSAATVTIPIGSLSGSLTYTAAAAGVVTISATNDRALTNPGPENLTVTSAAPTSYTMVASTTTPQQGSAITLTFSLNRAATQDVVITPSDGAAPGGFSAATLTIVAGQTSGTLTYTPTAAGNVAIAATNNRGLGNPATVNLVVSAFDPPTSIALQIDKPLLRLGRGTLVRFTLDKVATGNVTITPSSTLPGTFSPASVTLPAGFQTAVMTFTPAQAGAGVVSCANGAGLANPTPSPILCFAASRAMVMKLLR